MCLRRKAIWPARSSVPADTDIFTRLAEADSSSASRQRDVSASLDRLGNVLVAQGDLAGAKQQYQESFAIAKRLSAATPSSGLLQHGVSSSLNNLGDVLVAQGNLTDAKQRYQESSDIITRLAAADPSSASLQRDVTQSLNNLGDVLKAQGDLAGAKRRCQESRRSACACRRRIPVGGPAPRCEREPGQARRRIGGARRFWPAPSSGTRRARTL